MAFLLIYAASYCRAPPNGGLSVPVAGMLFEHTGPTSINDGSLIATNGARIRLPEAKSYTASVGPSLEIRAEGLGSKIDLPGVTTMAGNTWSCCNNVHVQARAGAQVDMSAVKEVIGGRASYTADGLGSHLDFSSLTGIQSFGVLTVRNGGRFTAPNLTTLDGTGIDIDDTAQMATSQLTSIVNGSITARRGSPDFSAVTSFSNSGASALDGAQLSLPGVTQYSANRSETVTLQAQGLGSKLDMSNVTSFSGHANTSYSVDVLARQGGRVLLSNVPANLVGGRATFDSQDFGSHIDLSLASAIQMSGALRAMNGGTIKIPGLTRLDGMTLQLDDTGALLNADGNPATNGITAQLVSLVNGGLHMVRSSYDFGNITTFSNSSAVAEGGATIRLPQIKTYTPNAPAERRIQATGLGSVVDLSGVTVLSGNTGPGSLLVQAQNGGRVDLSSVAPAIVGGTSTFQASGRGSVLDMSKVTTFSGNAARFYHVQVDATSGGKVDLSSLPSALFGAANYRSDGMDSVLDLSRATDIRTAGEMVASNGGVVLLNQSGSTTIDNTAVILNGGAIDAQSVTLGANASLRGTGTIQAALLNNGRLGTNTSWHDYGTPRIEGDFTQSGSGTTSVRIRGEEIRGGDFDAFDITGQATLGGRFEVLLPTAFRPEFGDSFEMLTAGSIVGHYARGGLAVPKENPDDPPMFLTSDVRGNSVYVVAALVGDSNFDGEFNTADLVTIFQAGLFETQQPATWRQGDWNGDGMFGTSDLVTAFQGGWYERGRPRAAVSPVPEPGSFILAVMALVGIAALRRIRLRKRSAPRLRPQPLSTKLSFE